MKRPCSTGIGMKNVAAGFSLRQHRLKTCATKAFANCLATWK
jgi:hypothetical protein